MNLEEAVNLGIVDRLVPLDGDWAARGSRRRLRAARRAGRAVSGAAARRWRRTSGRTRSSPMRAARSRMSIAAARATLGAALPRFVPGHPIAGHRAFGGGRGVLDALRRPQRRADAAAGDRPARASRRSPRPGRRAARACARSMPPRTTAIFAAVSHLPHLLAFALVDELAARARCRGAVPLRRQRLPRFHAHRRELVRNVARHRACEPRRTACRDQRVPCAARSRRRAVRPPAMARRSKRYSPARGPRAAPGIRTAARRRTSAAARRPARARDWRSHAVSARRGAAVAPASSISRRSHSRDRHGGAAGLEEHLEPDACCSPRWHRATRALRGLLDADDVDRMREALRALGVRIDARRRRGRMHRPWRPAARSREARARCSSATPGRRSGR